jgi:hypothetical protein
MKKILYFLFMAIPLLGTSQEVADLNFIATFENSDEGFVFSNGSQVNKWFTGTATASNSARSLYISNNSGQSNGYTNNTSSIVQAYKDVNIPVGTQAIVVKFDWKCNGEGYYDYMTVWETPVSYTPVAGTFTTESSGGNKIGNIFKGNPRWSTYTATLDVSAYAGTTRRFIFEWKNDNSAGGNPPAAVDNFIVGVASADCISPTGLSVMNITATSATLVWQPGVEMYEVVIVPQDQPVQDEMGISTSSNYFTATSLSPETCYSFYVRAVCGEAATSAWSNPYSFCLPEITNYNITGTLRFDANGDGICNTEDTILPNTPVQISGGSLNAPVTVYTNAQGEYNIPNVGSGLYNLQPILTTEFESFTAVPQQFTFSEVITTIASDICVPAPVTIQPDLTITLIPQDSPRPGFNVSYRVMVTNNSAAIFPGASVVFQFAPDRLSLLTTGSSIVAGNGTATISFASPFLPYASQIVNLDFLAAQPPVNNAGDTLSFLATLTPDGITDVVPANNTYLLNQIVVNSYDPNDIVVGEGALAAIEVIENQQHYMHYTINFQNTGSAEAVNVRLTNTLDVLFDAESFQPLASSHNYAVTRTGNELKFKFNNINLPYSNVDEPGSHGFITYRVKVSEGVQPEDVVQGTANIYFDFNPAIVTNTAVTEFYSVLNAESNAKQQIKLYPNPVIDLVNVSIAYGQLQSVSVYDINGRLCLQSGDETAISLAQLSSGLYMIKVVTDTGVSNYKLIKK